MIDWLILTATLPTKPSALRVRVWRALKATGAGSLREGVYLLPAQAPTAAALAALEQQIRDAGADAHLLRSQARDAAQQQLFCALFDRSEAFAELQQSLKETRGALHEHSEAELRKRLRALEQRLQQLQGIDFFPGAAGAKAAQALAALRREFELRCSPDEPAPREAGIEQLQIADFQGRSWATRRRPWVDRLASAWLIQRFIDRSPRFVWLADASRCPARALGYDFDGARFSHVGDRVSFETLAASFALDADTGLRRLGRLVHSIDVGGPPCDEAAGLELIVRGLQLQHPKNDDALLAAALPLFDALYAALRTPA